MMHHDPPSWSTISPCMMPALLKRTTRCLQWSLVIGLCHLLSKTFTMRPIGMRPSMHATTSVQSEPGGGGSVKPPIRDWLALPESPTPSPAQASRDGSLGRTAPCDTLRIIRFSVWMALRCCTKGNECIGGTSMGLGARRGRHGAMQKRGPEVPSSTKSRAHNAKRVESRARAVWRRGGGCHTPLQCQS